MPSKHSTTDRRSKTSTISPKKSLRKTSKSRRKNKAIADTHLYKLPKSEIKEFIASEKRHDELDRIREMQEQSRTWWKTIIICGIINGTFLLLAYIGWANGGN